MAESDEMLSRQNPHRDVVGKYSVDTEVVAPDHRYSTTSLLIRAQQFLGAGLLGRVDVARSRDDDAVDVLNHQRCDLLELLLRISSGVRDLHHEVFRQSRPHDAAGDLGKKWIVDLVDDQTDHRGSPAGQLPSMDIRYITEVARHTADLFGELSADPGLPIQGPRSGGKGNTGGGRDVAQQHLPGPNCHGLRAPLGCAFPQPIVYYLKRLRKRFRVARNDDRGDDVAQRTIRVIMNGVTGRMGYRQHLVRSVLAIRDDGGVGLAGGERITVEPILVGRNAEKLAALAVQHGVSDFTTDLDEALEDDSASVYFDAQVTSERKKSILKAIGAGKHIYTEKPIAESVDEGIELVTAAAEAGVINGVVHDKLYLPGLVKLKRLIDSGFFGRILSVRGEFGYWVFEGDLLPAQRPSWNYRAEDGGGMVLDMFPHWNYVLENLFGKVQAVTAKAVTHIPERWDEQGRKYAATADDSAYAIFELEDDVIAQINSSWAVRVDRGELVEFQVDGTHGSAVAGLFGCRIQPSVSTPMPVWNPDLPTTDDYRSQWEQIPDNAEFTNGFRAQWEQFLSDVDAGRPHAYDLAAGVRGLQLADAGLTSSAEGRRVAIDRFTP